MKSNEEPAQFPAPGEIRIMRTLPGPIERIWTYLTDPEKRSRWFAGGPMELCAGGRVDLLILHKNLSPTESPPPSAACYHHTGKTVSGRVLRCEPPRVLSYTFGESSDVTFELVPQGERVLMILTHRLYGGDRPSILGFSSGWHTHLAILLALLEGNPAPLFWATHDRVKVEYEKLVAS